MRHHSKVVGVIPARFDSQRLPGKVLMGIGPKAMVHWVYERASQSSLLNELFVATDDDRVYRYCAGHDIPVIITDRHASGTDRVHEVMERTDGDIYVNIQGDEPTIRAEHIALLLNPLLERKCDVTTLKVEINAVEALNPNIVKVVTDKDCRALYFSRCPIPFDRDGLSANRYYKHIGLYAYGREALKHFHKLPQSSLELAEKLEQLRFLESGISVHVSETVYDTVGVDTEGDLKKATAILLARS